MSRGVWLRRLCAALMEDRWEGRQDGGGNNMCMHMCMCMCMCMHMCMCMLFAILERDWPLAFTGSVSWVWVWLFISVVLFSLLYMYRRGVSVSNCTCKLYQISQSGSAGHRAQSARLFDFNFLWDITNIDLLKFHAMSHTISHAACYDHGGAPEPAAGGAGGLHGRGPRRARGERARAPPPSIAPGPQPSQDIGGVRRPAYA